MSIDLTSSVPSQLVAEYLLWIRRGLETTPMHILKLTYLCHGWMLGLAERSLISEPAEAWQYGPVVPSLYHRYKSFRGNPIRVEPLDKSLELAIEQRGLIKTVEEVYREYTAWELSSLTHQPGTPWDIVRKRE